MLLYDPTKSKEDEAECRQGLLIDLDYAADSDEYGNALAQFWDGSDANENLPIPEEENEKTYADMSSYLPHPRIRTDPESPEHQVETKSAEINAEADDIWADTKNEASTSASPDEVHRVETDKRRRDRGQRTVSYS